jgi:hypothetical protein
MEEKCPAEQFVSRIFWRTLYPHARVVAPFILLFQRSFFEADRSLISAAGDACDMKRIREDVRDFFWDSNNRGWVRRRINIRVSGQKLKDLAREYLPEGVSVPPFPPAATHRGDSEA